MRINSLLIKPAEPLTLTELKSKLVSRYPWLVSIAKSTLSRWLKNDLLMSYTKMSNMNPKVLKAENILQIARCASLIFKLITNNVEIIFIDEFSVNDRSHKQYELSTIGSKSLFVDRKSQFSFSFMIGLSQRCYYPVYGVKGTFECTHFYSLFEGSDKSTWKRAWR